MDNSDNTNVKSAEEVLNNNFMLLLMDHSVENDTHDRNLSSIVLDQYINNVSKELPEFHGPALQEWKTPLQLLLPQPRACAPESLHTPRGFVEL